MNELDHARGTLGTVLIAVLMLLMVYRRFKFLRRGHRLRPLLMILRNSIWALVGVSLMLLPWTSAPVLSGALAVGSALGVYALSRVEIERIEHRTFYKSNSYVGTVVFVLFTARVLWRLVERVFLGRPLWAGRLARAEAPTPPDSTPITMVLLFVVIGYSVCFTTGLLIRARPPRPAAE